MRTCALMILGLMIATPAMAQTPGTSTAFGRALQLDSNAEYAWASPNTAGLPEGTVEMWIWADDLPAFTAIWSGGNGHPGTTGDWTRLGTHSSTNGLSFGIYWGSWRWAASGMDQLGTGWSHLAGTWGPAGVQFYIDGQHVGSSSFTGAMPNHAIELIGNSAWDDGFAGLIDELRIWNVARSEAQLQAAMSDTLDVSAHPAGSGLVAYYRFDELEDLGVDGDGADDVRDLSANANHADTVGDPPLVLPGTVSVERETWGGIKARYALR